MGNDIPKENIHYTCIVCITIDSVLTIDKKNHPQVYLEECKYKVKKLKSDSESDSDLNLKKIEAKVDDELEQPGSDSE